MNRHSLALSVVLVGVSGGCAKSTAETIKIDGSSTVYPITEAVAEEFGKGRKVQVTVGVSGTGGGFKKLCAGEIDIAGASRPIKPSEVDLCEKHAIAYVELPIAYDGLAVVIHPKNTWATSMTTAELKTMWEPAAQGRVTKWSDVRAGWPDREMHLFGAGVDSGTYDYFTEAIVHKEHASRGDYTSSEDDNVIVQGIAKDELALCFFGFAYFDKNRDKLRVVAIDDGKPDNGDGPIAPSPETIRTGTYQPLARPIFIYASANALEKTHVRDFVSFYLHAGPERLVAEVGYVPLPERTYGLVRARAAAKTPGSVFGGKGSQIAVSLDTLLQAPSAAVAK